MERHNDMPLGIALFYAHFMTSSFGKFYALQWKRVGKLRESDTLLGEPALVLREYNGLD